MPDISPQLIQLRKDLGLTQKELADRVGIDQSMISDYELGKFLPTQKTIRKFAKQGIIINLDENLLTQLRGYPTREGKKEKEMKEDISQQIIKLRENLGLNQSAFARKIGVSPTTLCEIESGKRDISNTTLRKIKDKVGVNLNSNVSSNLINTQKVETMSQEIGKIVFTFNIANKTFELKYCNHIYENNTYTYTLILNQEYFDFIEFLSIHYPSQVKNMKVDNVEKVLLLISHNNVNYFYTLQIKGNTTGIVTFKPSNFEDIFEKAEQEEIKNTTTQIVETKEKESNPDRDILILCQKIIQIRDLFNELLEQAEAVVQPIADKPKKEEEKKEEPKVVEVVNKAYKREAGTINYVEVGILDSKNQLIFNIPHLSESKCKELQQNHWKTYSRDFSYRTIWTYSNGETKEGKFVDIVPTNKIQEVESSNGQGVIGYAEHKAGIVEVIYYDRFVE